MIKQRTELNFGFGDIMVASAINNDGIGALFCQSGDPKPIGTVAPLLEHDIDDSEVMITFNNIESVENMINHLHELRGVMLKHKRDMNKEKADDQT